MSQEEDPLFCPSCHSVSMIKCASMDADIVIDRCPDCHGLWFDAGELRQMLRSENLKERFLGGSTASLASGEATVEASATRTCPRCDRALDPLELGGVEANVCVGCSGIWLDDHELLQLVIAGRGGELEGDESSLAYEIREGLAKGSLTPGLLRQLLDALKDWLERHHAD